MFYGTHNSATYANIVWWQYPFKWLSNLTSKCQSLTIKEQLEKNVKVFNFQVAYYKKEWYISHGLFIYNIKLLDVLKLLKEKATKDNKLYFQLYLDKNFILGQDIERFKVLKALIESKYINENLRLTRCWIEGTNELLYGEGLPFTFTERYWTKSWATNYAKTILDKLPLPKRWAKLNNKEIKENNNYDCLMLDFVEI